jgi:signal transduction histidine kinase
MNIFLTEIISLLTQSPGNMVYHLVLTFSVAGALQVALSYWRNSQFPQGRRLVIGLSLLLVIRVAMFALAGFGWQGLINDHLLLPPVDRAATLISLLVILWMWSFPEPLRMADAATWLVGLLGLTGMVLSLVWWMGQGSSIDYNGSWGDFIGQVATIVLAVAGGLILLIRKPNGWGLGLGMMCIALAGHIVYLVLPFPKSDFSGIVRLAQMAYYPFLFALPQRFPLPSQQAPSPAAPPERRRTAADPKLLESFLSLGSESNPEKVCQAITSAVAAAMLADICLLLTPPDERGDLMIQCGYDLIREENMDGALLPGKSASLIATALSRGLPLRLPASSTSEDLRALGNSLNLERSGHLLVAPVMSPENQPIAGLLLLSPYSNRAWTGEDQAQLSNFSRAMAHLLQRSQALAALQNELERTRQELQTALEAAGELHDANQSMQNQLQSAQEQSETNRLKAESLAALIASQGAGTPEAKADTMPEGTTTLASTRRQSTLLDQAPLPAVGDYMEGELRLALEEVARLNAALSEADQKYLTLKNGQGGKMLVDESSEEISNIVQELRQPMSSMVGYTDFLLSESVGILGALQRKFLERIKFSAERMDRLVNELVRLTIVDMGSSKTLTAEGMDLYSAVEGALSESIDGLRQKDINLRVEVPEQLPPLNADQDAIKQVLVNLLENAREVTPPGGEITLRASLQGGDHQQAYLLVQISDQGGGISSEYMPRVFSRFGHADGKPIPGTGGKSSHLSVVKMLVENSGGRIWVDSQLEIGATFSILLPVASEELLNSEPGGMQA